MSDCGTAPSRAWRGRSRRRRCRSSHPFAGGLCRRPDFVVFTGALVVASAVCYFVVLVLVFGRTLRAVLWNSDAASPLVFARTVAREPLGSVVLGKISYATTLWFDLLVRA